MVKVSFCLKVDGQIDLSTHLDSEGFTNLISFLYSGEYSADGAAPTFGAMVGSSTRISRCLNNAERHICFFWLTWLPDPCQLAHDGY
jgi:hypothetical protein